MGRRISDLSKEPVEGRFYGARLREIRLAAGMTIEKLSEEIGVGRNYISQLENGDRVPSFATLIRISNVLKSTSDCFLRDYFTDEQKTTIRISLLEKEFSALSEDQQEHIEKLIKEETTYLKNNTV